MTTSPSRSTEGGSDGRRKAPAWDERPSTPEGGKVVPMRLQRFLARAGVASRRGSEDLMTAGRVAVNGVVVTELGSKVDPLVDTVSVDGRDVRLDEGAAYLAMNKPRGVVTTMSDPQGRPTVADLMPPEPAGLFPVGRLDLDSEGLLLLTTDGELANRLMHPRHHVLKRYQVRITGVPNETALKALRDGLLLEDGMTLPAEVRLVRRIGNDSELEVGIREGRKRQVRRMFEAVGHRVTRLQRTSFGPVELGDLALGDVRELTAREVEALRDEAET